MLEQREGFSAQCGQTAAQYIVGALMALVTWWLDRNIKLTPEEMDRAFRRLTVPVLQSISRN